LLLGKAGLEPGVSTRAERRYRSAEGMSEAAGEAIDLIAFVFALVFFFKFSPKIACQVRKPHNPIKINNIRVEN
jgi:hypothetical protein